MCRLPNRSVPAIFSTDVDQELVQSAGLGTIAEIIEQMQHVPFRHRGRVTAPVDFHDRQGFARRLYVKLQIGPSRRIPRPRDLLSGYGWTPAPLREWIGLQALRELGLHAVRPVACFRQEGREPAAAIVIEAVPVAQSLHEWIGGGGWQQESVANRHRILVAIANVVQRMHIAGYAWRSLSTKHLYGDLTNIEPRIWLIDCEGVERRSGVRVMRRDHDKLLHWMRYSGADDDDRHFLAELLQSSQPRRSPLDVFAPSRRVA